MPPQGQKGLILKADHSLKRYKYVRDHKTLIQVKILLDAIMATVLMKLIYENSETTLPPAPKGGKRR